MGFRTRESGSLSSTRIHTCVQVHTKILGGAYIYEYKERETPPLVIAILIIIMKLPMMSVYHIIKPILSTLTPIHMLT